jgi:hypothetical protein
MKVSQLGTRVKFPSREQIKVFPLATTHEQPFPLTLYRVIDSSAPDNTVDCPNDPDHFTVELIPVPRIIR